MKAMPTRFKSRTQVPCGMGPIPSLGLPSRNKDTRFDPEFVKRAEVGFKVLC